MGIFEFVMTQVNSNPIFGAAFYLTVFTAIIYQLKAVPEMIYERFKKVFLYSIYFNERDILYKEFEKWLIKNYKHKYRKIEALMEEDNDFTENDYTLKDSIINGGQTKSKPKSKINFIQSVDSFIIRYKGKFLLVTVAKDKLENANNSKDLYIKSFTIFTLFNYTVLENILKTIVAKYDKDSSTKDTQMIKYNQSDYWNTLDEVEFRDENTIFMNGEVKGDIFKHLDNFVKSEKWYKDRAIPYKYGMFMYGPPGNGKTSLVQALAKKYKRDLCVLNINDNALDDDDLRSLFKNLSKNSILVVEDIDALFTSKRKMTNSNLNFSTLLNCLDGIFSKQNIITVFTTNKKYELDKALLRPGRVDYQIEIPNPNLDCIKRYYHHFFGIHLTIKKLKRTWSMAEVQDICLKNVNTPKEVNKLL